MKQISPAPAIVCAKHNVIVHFVSATAWLTRKVGRGENFPIWFIFTDPHNTEALEIQGMAQSNSL